MTKSCAMIGSSAVHGGGIAFPKSGRRLNMGSTINRRQQPLSARRLISALVPWIAAWCIPTVGADAGPNPPDGAIKKLIEFGWDEPDTSFLRRHVDAVERAPFDGCVFHVVASDAQGKQENFTWL